jgi:hypothetical protein
MKVIHVFTSAACNYIPKVRVLVESIRKWHPEWRIHLALSDELPEGLDLSNEPFDEVHLASSLEIPDFKGWAFCHTIVEFSTAIKPYMLKKLLARDDCAGVVYLDPDTVVFSRLDDMLAGLEAGNIALTPHQTIPETRLSAVIDNEICSLKHGIYNLGFIAVRPTIVGKAFANWWAERIYYFCRAEIPNGLFTDQRWIDLVPAFFEDVCILRTSRLNVSTWNLTTREVTGTAPFEVVVDDEPLGFYHFSGFDSGAIQLMVEKNAGGNKTVEALVAWYTDRTAGLSDDPLSAVPWHFGRFADGSIINANSRLVYRQRLDLQRSFPDPFAVSEGGYKDWWQKRGPIEFKNLFDPKQSEAETLRLRNILTPGFQAGKSVEQVSVPLLMGQIEKALRSSSHRNLLTRRAWEILRTEGFPGIKRRLLQSK